ncbi:hypothetical protein YTPLAS18_30640 [Nitrospira sp.]|nr:hypothetical protein YTPLAS18_30640 [Nitrospira sp.]
MQRWKRAICAGAVGAVFACGLFAAGAGAVVQLLPDATLTREGGAAVTGKGSVADDPTVKEILAAFGRTESAVNAQDLEALMTFYAKAFNYHGLKHADVRRIWTEVFEHYRGVSSTHLFSDIQLIRDEGQLRAEVTCTGGLYGTERRTGKAITLDSWFHEVHYLVKDHGAWRFLGNAGDAPTSAPFASAPHHPLF